MLREERAVARRVDGRERAYYGLSCQARDESIAAHRPVGVDRVARLENVRGSVGRPLLDWREAWQIRSVREARAGRAAGIARRQLIDVFDPRHQLRRRRPRFAWRRLPRPSHAKDAQQNGEDDEPAEQPDSTRGLKSGPSARRPRSSAWSVRPARSRSAHRDARSTRRRSARSPLLAVRGARHRAGRPCAHQQMCP